MGLPRAGHVWLSNNCPSERPYSVTGTVKHEGSEEAPKYNMLRKKYRNVESCECGETLFSTKQWIEKIKKITILNHSESSGMSNEVSVMEMEQ